MKSPFQYPGGKRRLLKKLFTYFPDTPVLVEPFVGGGSVFLAATKYARYIINDIDPGVADFWKIILNGTKEEYENLCTYIINVKPMISSLKEFKKIEDGVHTILTNLWSYGGIIGDTSRAVVAKDRQDDFEKRHKKLINRVLKRIGLIRCLKGKVQVFCEDYSTLYVPSDAFIYADPPYVKESRELYRYSKFDHSKFSKWIQSQTVPWLVSYDDCSMIRDLYNGYRILSWRETSRITDNGSFEKPEVLIFSKNIKKDFSWSTDIIVPRKRKNNSKSTGTLPI